MSWRHRKYRNYNQTYKSKFYFSEKEIDFSSGFLDYGQFLLQEFFTADLETRPKLFNTYMDGYGSRSSAYLKRKYSEWATGNYHLTDLMRERIISIMPQYLNDSAKYKLGINEFMTSIKNTITEFQVNQKATYAKSKHLNKPQNIVSIFEKEFENIQALNIRHFRFNVLTEDEKFEALEIAKYILEIKLQKAFDQIERDFNIFLPYMKKFKRGIFSATYSISVFNLNVDITQTGIEDIEIPKFNINVSEANSRFKEYSDKYIAYELVAFHKEVNKLVSKSFLNSNDIQLFFFHYNDLSKGESEVSMNSLFQGEGGTLALNAKMKPLKLLKTSIIISSIKLAIYFIVIVTLVSFCINQKFFKLLIFGGFFVGIFAWSYISEEIDLLKSLTKEYIKYGQ